MHELIASLLGRGVTPVAVPSLLQVFTPRVEVGDTISIPLKNPIIMPTLDRPSPSSSPGTRNKGQPVLGQTAEPGPATVWYVTPTGWLNSSADKSASSLAERESANWGEENSLPSFCPCPSSKAPHLPQGLLLPGLHSSRLVVSRLPSLPRYQLTPGLGQLRGKMPRQRAWAGRQTAWHLESTTQNGAANVGTVLLNPKPVATAFN